MQPNLECDLMRRAASSVDDGLCSRKTVTSCVSIGAFHAADFTAIRDDLASAWHGKLLAMSKPTFLLVHGSWQASWSWDPVRARLHAAGYRTLAPTLPGHAPGADRSAVRFADYESSVLNVLDHEAEGPVVLVGHSFAGAIISRIAELRAERCQSLVYYSGFVPRDGESVADNLPVAMLEAIRHLSANSDDGSVALPYEQFRGAFVNTTDEASARQLFSRFAPEPCLPIFEPLALPHNHRHGVPATFVACQQDLSLGPGVFHPGQSSRLDRPRLIEIDGDHEALLTNSDALADALLLAAATESVV
jgi:pimeloyl-ACP methyl ester carboxylesterase